MKSLKDTKKFSRKLTRVLWIAIPLIFLSVGVYLLVLLFAPIPYEAPSSQIKWNEPVAKKVELNEQRVYIPRLSLNLKYANNESALLDGLWHRFSERGDPEKGGNLILAGHRFEVGYTPGETRRKSPLYHVDKMQEGDYIYVDFNGKRYAYEITRNYEVKPTQIEIEQPTETPRLTMYTCTLKGEADGREVLEATLVQTDVDPTTELKISR